VNKVYVSYARKDRDPAQTVVEAIRQAGFDVLLDLDISPGQDLWCQISSAECVVVLWSVATMQAEWVQDEIRHFIHAWSFNRLVLVSLDDTPLPVGLRDLPVIPFRVGSDSDMNLLLERIQVAVRQTDGDEEDSHLKKILTIDSAIQSNLRETTLARQEDDASLPPDRSMLPPVATRTRRSPVRWIVTLVAFIIVIFGIGARFLLPGLSGDNYKTVVLPKTIEVSSSPSGLVVVSMVLGALIVGAGTGAGIFWIWTRRSRRSSTQVNEAIDALTSNEGQSGKFAQPFASLSSDSPEVFISYSRRDASTVDQLVKEIEQLGQAVWIDRSQPGSQRYAGPIVRAIQKSRLVALMCSEHAFASDNVIREVYVAGDYKKPFVVFQLDPTEFPAEFVLFITGYPRIPVASMDMQQLRSEITKLIAVRHETSTAEARR